MGARGPKPGQGHKFGGRTKGTPNKIPATVKQMVLAALTAEGGIDYLRQQARDNPTPFLTLLAKIVPQQINAEVEQRVTEVRETIVDPGR